MYTKTYVTSMAAYVQGLNPYVIRPVLKPRSPTFASPAWLFKPGSSRNSEENMQKPR